MYPHFSFYQLGGWIRKVHIAFFHSLSPPNFLFLSSDRGKSVRKIQAAALFLLAEKLLARYEKSRVLSLINSSPRAPLHFSTSEWFFLHLPVNPNFGKIIFSKRGEAVLITSAPLI